MLQKRHWSPISRSGPTLGSGEEEEEGGGGGAVNHWNLVPRKREISLPFRGLEAPIDIPIEMAAAVSPASWQR